MKTTILRCSTLLFLLVACVVITNAQNSFFEDVFENEVLVSRIKYEKDFNGKFIQAEKFNYEYDTENRVIKEEASKWNAKKNQWEPDYLTTFNYDSTQCVIEKRKWNKKTKDYSILIARQDVQIVADIQYAETKR